jgi:hypothetical protein
MDSFIISKEVTSNYHHDYERSGYQWNSSITLLGYTAVVFIALVSSPANGRARQVDAFTIRRDQCDYFRGEELYDTARAREIAAKVKRYCTGTDRELRRLRKKYAHNPRVLQRLSQYEVSVE